MPELPEVESVARALRPLVCGKQMRRCRVVHAIAARPHGARFLEKNCSRRRILKVQRFGKFLVLELDQGCIVLHFRLDGQLVWFSEKKIAGHIDVAFELENGTLGFVDRRHFGRVQWFPSPLECPGIAALGVDPLTPEFDADYLAALLKRSRRPLKLLLLDQSRIAGLGNIYSSESLWRAKLDPRRMSHSLDSAAARRLQKAIVSILRAAIECCSNPAPDFRDPAWWFQGLERILGVYRREGRRCRRCRARIKRIEQGGRSTFFCPACQR